MDFSQSIKNTCPELCVNQCVSMIFVFEEIVNCDKRKLWVTLLFWWHDVVNVVVNSDSDASWFIYRYHYSANILSFFFYGKSTSQCLMGIPQDLDTIRSKDSSI